MKTVICRKDTINHATRALLIKTYIEARIDQWVTFDDLRAYFLTTHEIELPDSYLTSPVGKVAETYPQSVVLRGQRVMWESSEGRGARLTFEEDQAIQKEVADIVALRQRCEDLRKQVQDMQEEIDRAQSALLTKRGEKGFQAALAKL